LTLLIRVVVALRQRISPDPVRIPVEIVDDDDVGAHVRRTPIAFVKPNVPRAVNLRPAANSGAGAAIVVYLWAITSVLQPRIPSPSKHAPAKPCTGTADSPPQEP